MAGKVGGSLACVDLKFCARKKDPVSKKFINIHGLVYRDVLDGFGGIREQTGEGIL